MEVKTSLCLNLIVHYLRRWYHVWVSFDETSRSLSIGQIPVFNDFDLDGVKLAEIVINRRPQFNPKQPLLIAAHREDKAVNHFNGKIERPFILNFSANQEIILDIATGNSNSGVIAAWDFSQRIGDNKVNDLGPANLIGKIVNLPTQAVKSSKWMEQNLIGEKTSALRSNSFSRGRLV